MVDTKRLTQLLQMISNHFDEEDVRTVCYMLAVEYDDLPGPAKKFKVRELIKYMIQRGRLEELVEICQKERPNLPWFDITSLSAPKHGHIKNPHLRPDERGVFLGRKRELAWLHSRFHNPAIRLIGISGQGGYGKTSLISH